MRKIYHFLAAIPLLLAGCAADVRETLGLSKEAPDEFVVVSRPPLVVPPDFELKPPSTEAASLAPSTEQQAQKTLFGDAAAKPLVSKTLLDTNAADATASFLDKAGVSQASPDIRQQLGVDAKAAIPSKGERTSLYEEMIGKEKSDAVVDSAKEAARILENKKSGKSVTEGDTPTVTPAPKSVIDKIF